MVQSKLFPLYFLHLVSQEERLLWTGQHIFLHFIKDQCKHFPLSQWQSGVGWGGSHSRGGGSTLLIRQWSLMVDHLSCGSVEPEVYTQVQHDVVHACSPLHPMETKDIWCQKWPLITIASCLLLKPHYRNSHQAFSQSQRRWWDSALKTVTQTLRTHIF